MWKIKVFVVVMLTLCPYTIMYGLFNPQDAAQAIMLPFLSSTEAQKKQLDDIDIMQTEIKKREGEAGKNITKALVKLNLDINETQTKLKTAQEDDAEVLSKKMAALNMRKQVLYAMQELWKEILISTEQRITITKESIEYTQAAKPQPKALYTWKEFRETQLKFSEHQNNLEREQQIKENLKKQFIVEKETELSLQKQIDAKNKDREKIISQLNLTGKGATSLDSQQARLEIDCLEQEINLLKEKSDYSKLKTDAFSIKEKLNEKHIELLQNRLNDHKALLARAERRLILDFDDVEIAKTEWKNELQKALQAKEDLGLQRDPKKLEYEKLSIELDFLKEKLKQLKAKGKKEALATIVTRSQVKKTNSLRTTLEKEIQQFDAKKDLADLKTKIKELQYITIDLRYRQREEQIDIESIIANFQNQKDFEINLLKSFREKRIDAVNLLIECKRNLEALKITEDKTKTKKSGVFKDQPHLLQEAISNYHATRTNLGEQLLFTQDYLAISSDLIHQQENIVNLYDLIITDLESHKISQSIWKRSDKAISFDMFKTSIAHGEQFLKKLFWATPAFLAPSTLWTSTKALTMLDYILFCLFIIFFLVSYFVTYTLLQLFVNRIKKRVSTNQAQFPWYVTFFTVFIEFTLKHFSVLFTWFFLWLHIIGNFKYIFASMQKFSDPYYVSMFYIATIPIFIYISGHFLAMLKNLNQYLNYLFFSQNIQDRFWVLISIILFSTSILLPLRSAFMCLSDITSPFSDVLIAAYSLILLVVVLFFFTKDDILKVIPAHNSFFIWLKKKVDKYYYPVFFFIMGLLILSNPYIGYSNLAWFGAFAISLSLLFLYLLFFLHYLVRQYSICLFMIEDEDEIQDRFEHAKTYYGFFVIFSFLLLLFATSIFIARIWGFDYSPADLWKLLAETWAIPFGLNNKLGFVQFMVLVLFIVGGFLISSLIHKFVLSKLFDILRTEPGLQNTISRIMHYVFIAIAILLGFISIHLEQFILVISGLLGIGLGLALKDIIADIVAGFFVLIERPIEIGNYIQLDTIEGTVHKIAARSTTIVTGRNFTVIVPNKDLLTKAIINWGHGRFAIGVEINARVTHDANPELVKKLLLAIVQKNPVILKVPVPAIRLEDLEENGLRFFVRAFISARRVKEHNDIASQLRFELLRAFRENDINLAMPQRVIHKAIDITFEKPPSI